MANCQLAIENLQLEISNSAYPPALVLALSLLAHSEASAMVWHWSNPLPHGNDVVDMTWNGVLGFQAAELGRVYLSGDLIDWLPCQSSTTNDLQAVTYFGNRILITGANGLVGYSDDGVNFTTSSLNPTNWLVSVATSSNLAVAVGDNAVIYTSATGTNWQGPVQAPNDPGGNYWLLSAAWGAGTFVIAGEHGYLATSPDGTHWTAHLVSTNLSLTEDIEKVAWISTGNSPGSFPYTGFWASTYNGHALYSTNSGANWQLFSGVGSTNALYGIAANNSSALLAGDSDVRLGNPASNGIAWSKQTGAGPTMAPVWTYYASVCDTNGIYHLAGADGMLVQGAPTNNNYAWSMDFPSVRDWLWQVTVAGNLYVAVGDHARIMTSQNGADWSIEAIPETNSVTASNSVFFCVGGTTNLLVAAGNQGSLAISPATLVPVIITNLDGTIFTNTVNAVGVLWYSLPAPTTNDLAGVCLFSNRLFLVGGNATMLSSSDGTNWSRVSVPTNIYLSGIAASSNTLVVVGNQGAILTSPDGINWTPRASGTTNWLWRLRYLCGRFIAVGENGTLLQSTNNGAAWFSTPSGVTTWLNDAVMVTNTCYVVGTLGTVLTSTNFVNWSNAGTITARSLYGAATQDGQLVVVGIQGTILRSQVVPILAPVNFIAYAQSSGLNLFLVACTNIVGSVVTTNAGGATVTNLLAEFVPDQQFTLDSSTNLLNWTTGPLLTLPASGTLVFITPQPTNPPSCQYYRTTLVVPP